MKNPNSKWLKFAKSPMPFILVFILQAPVFVHVYIQHNNIGYRPVWLAVLMAVIGFYFIYVRILQPKKLKRIIEAILFSILLGFVILYIDLTIAYVAGAFLNKG